MELNGREVHFRRTIWATNAIMKMCPGGDLARFSELLTDTADQILTMASFVAIMSEGYELQQEFEAKRRGETYERDPITLDEIMALEDIDLFNRLQEEALKAWTKDAETTVESEPPKSKKKASQGRK